MQNFLFEHIGKIRARVKIYIIVYALVLKLFKRGNMIVFLIIHKMNGRAIYLILSNLQSNYTIPKQRFEFLLLLTPLLIYLYFFTYFLEKKKRK